MAKNTDKKEEIDDEESMEIIMLADGEGAESEYVHIATLEYKGEWYCYLHPLEADDVDDDEMFIFHIELDDEENEVFVLVEDKETLDKLYEVYLKDYNEANKN